MPLREIRYEQGIDEQLKKLRVSYQRLDEVMDFVSETLSSSPEAFPVIPGTHLSLCLTNEFVGDQYQHIPALAIFFNYDHQTITVVSIEDTLFESYGL